jgi:hypothetical protein
MNNEEIIANLPPLHQKLAVLVIGLIGVLWIMRMVHYRKIREEHALLWFLGIGAGIVTVCYDPLLIGLTSVMGVDVPASSLLLLTLFFLFIVCVWLTSKVSSQQQQIAKLIIGISILQSRVTPQTPPGAQSEDA